MKILDAIEKDDLHLLEIKWAKLIPGSTISKEDLLLFSQKLERIDRLRRRQLADIYSYIICPCAIVQKTEAA